MELGYKAGSMTVESNSITTAATVNFEEAKLVVQDFQVRRLKRDFRDLRMSDEYGPFCEFFASEIYSARDFTERNESFRKLTKQFHSVLGEEIYTGLVRLLDLHSLTDELDSRITNSLIQMGCPVKFTESQYEIAYRDLDNYDERVKQIEMILESLTFTHHISQMTWIGVVLKSARVATGLFTKDRVVGLLETAYSTLRGIKNVDFLNEEVRSREVGRLNRIYGITG